MSGSRGVKNKMFTPSKTILNRAVILLVVFFIGFALSSGIIQDGAKRLSDRVMPGLKERLSHHILTLVVVDAKHYFLLPVGGYSKELFTQPLSPVVLASILGNSIFHVLFQPVFLCPFTPQVIINLVLLPFFLYAVVKYFKKVWLMLAIFIVMSFQVGIYDSGIEALIRHGMSCELIYLLIGLAGFTGLITRRSY